MSIRSGRRRPLLAATVVVVAAACVSACGSGSDPSNSSTAAPRPTAATPPPAPAPTHVDGPKTADIGGFSAHRHGDGGSPARKRHREARERATYQRRRYGSPSKQSAPFAKYSGESKTKGQPKLHLAEFGKEAETGDRGEVTEVLQSYLAAVHGSEWAAACSYLTREGQAQLLTLLPESTGDGSCAQALPKALTTFDGSTHPSPASAPEGVASLRVKRGGRSGEGAGFALFHSEGADYWVAAKREGGEWLLLSIAPQKFSQ